MLWRHYPSYDLNWLYFIYIIVCKLNIEMHNFSMQRAFEYFVCRIKIKRYGMVSNILYVSSELNKTIDRLILSKVNSIHNESYLWYNIKNRL